MLRLIEIPQHSGAVLATGSAEGSVGGDGDGVDVTSVADVVGLELAGREFPNLERWTSQYDRLQIRTASSSYTKKIER